MPKNINELDKLNENEAPPPNVPFLRLMAYGSVIALVVWLTSGYWYGPVKTTAKAEPTEQIKPKELPHNDASAGSKQSAPPAPPAAPSVWDKMNGGDWADRSAHWSHGEQYTFGGASHPEAVAQAKESPLRSFVRPNETSVGADSLPDDVIVDEPPQRNDNTVVVTQPKHFSFDSRCTYAVFRHEHPNHCEFTNHAW